MSTPGFGGTNGVSELDIGQVGSVRRGAGTALWVGHVVEGEDNTVSVINSLGPQNVIIRGVGGFRGRRVTWSGNLKVADDAMLGTILAELAARKHGSTRTAGLLGAPNLALLRATQLTNHHGRVLSGRATLEGFTTGRVLRITGNATLNYLTPLELVFTCLS